MNRREVLLLLAGTTALPDRLLAIGRTVHQRVRVGTLRTLNPHQNETVATIAELIIPKTDTLGAKEALVNRFIDRVLAAETRENQQKFLAILAFIDGECIKRYRMAFVNLPGERQIEFLKLIAYPQNLITWGDNKSQSEGYSHFQNLKVWISQAFYNSEIGMKELGWDENVFHAGFEGCTHPPKTHE